MKYPLCLFVLLLASASLASAEAVKVRVGAYDFPPFFETYQKGTSGERHTGATIDLIDVFNQMQSEYEFELFVTSPSRRYIDFEENMIDMLFFENIAWGWEGYPVEASDVFMGGGEVYVALKKEGRDQSFFDELSERNLVGILGYHYGFAGFNSNVDYLSRNFHIFLSANHERNLMLILLDRPKLAEVAIVTQSYLNLFTRRHRESQGRFLVSDKYDQIYRHSILVRTSDKPGVVEVNKMLQQIQTSGRLTELQKKYGLIPVSE